MDKDPEHLRYKAEMTSALYVAHDLDPTAEESFELHLMECPQCVEDVEAWRAIQKQLPLATSTAVAPAAGTSSAPAVAASPPQALSATAARASDARPLARRGHWRLAASLVGIALIGAAAGWYGRTFADPGLGKTAFFSAPALERGAAECTALIFGPDTRRIALRVAGVASERKVVALSSRREELASRDYSARRQADGSWLVQFAPSALADGALSLESRGAGESAEPLGCFSAPQAP
jgi:hypothetical protein